MQFSRVLFFETYSDEVLKLFYFNMTAEPCTEKNNQNMPNENQDQTIKHSDFSIDHILNRAGNSYINKSDTTRLCETTTSDFGSFQWLQCSRYCPPRIPRMHRKDVQKRQLGRHPRIPFSSYQLSMLEQKFKETPYLSSEEVIVMSRKLQLADIRVKIWFQNRRARERREKNGVGDSKMKEDWKVSQRNNVTDCCVDNRLYFSGSHSGQSKVLVCASEEQLEQNIVKLEINSSPIDFSTSPLLGKNVNGILNSDNFCSPIFSTTGVHISFPNKNFSNNKDDKS